MNQIDVPVIPDNIRIHLGAPDEPAADIVVPFDEYIKNVASNEVYPTWPESALIANVIAQMSFALNRIYTEYYPSRGYDFDITNDTTVDQSFVVGGEIYDNIERIVNDNLGTYIRRDGYVEPLFAAYCDGINTTCNGLSQWGTVSLANEGGNSLEILENYYGSDIELVTGAPRGETGIDSLNPPLPLRPGEVGTSIRTLQIRLNRISANYPSIPKIPVIDGIFGSLTEDALLEFQRIFGLDQTGIVDEASWYKIRQIYNGVKRLNELLSEGVTYNEASLQFVTTLQNGDTGLYVAVVRYLLGVIAQYYEDLGEARIGNVYDDETENIVRRFQEYFDLPVTGIVNEATYDAIIDAYLGIIESLPENIEAGVARPYPGFVLLRGDEGTDVTTLQEYINAASTIYDEIPSVTVDGLYGNETYSAVEAAQRLFGLEVTGSVDALTWNEIASAYEDATASDFRSEGQYPGYVIETEA